MEPSASCRGTLLATALLLAATDAAADTRHDVVSVVSIAVTSTLLGSVIHEGLGHAASCAARGGRPTLSIADVSCEAPDPSTAGERWSAASGTVTNLVAGGLSLGALELEPPSSAVNYYALWLFSASNLFTGGGYLMADAVFQFGDWADFNATFEHPGALRVGEFVTGAGIYLGTFLLARERLEPLLGDEPGRRGRAAILTVVPYAVSGVLLPAAAAIRRRPGAIVSAALASLGGLSGLAWMWAYVDRDGAPSSLRMERSWPWVAAGAASLGGIAVLAYGIQF